MSDFISRYDPKQAIANKKYKEAMDKAMDAIAKARHEWTDRIMQAILPDTLYAMAKSNKMADRQKVARWMAKKKIRFVEWPDRTEIKRHGEILGRFFATFKDGKMHVEASIKKGLVKPQVPAYERDDSGEIWWCKIHNRVATHIFNQNDGVPYTRHCCDPNLGGILAPCICELRKSLPTSQTEAQSPNSAQDNPSVVPPDSDASTGPADKGGAS